MAPSSLSERTATGEQASSSPFEIIEPGQDAPLPDRPPPPYDPGWRQRLQDFLDRNIPKLALPLALLVGSAITTGTTYALVVRVSKLIRNAKVSSDPAVWMNQVRIRDYDPCYLGCDDCTDTEYSYKACIRTASIQTGNPNITCDGTKIWNWADRYPIACLSARGEHYRNIKLEALKQDYRNQLAIIILTVLGGLVGGMIVYAYWMHKTAKMRERAQAAASHWPGWRRREARVRRHNRIKTAIFGLLPVFAKGANAYLCVKGGSVNMYLTNRDRTISVNVRGWLSDCYDETHCTWKWNYSAPNCSFPSCLDRGYSVLGCSAQECMVQSCQTTTYIRKTPLDFVRDILPQIKQCNFRAPHGRYPVASLRLANPGFEKNWWVRIDVNGYNVTNPEETDWEIACLHSVGDMKPPQAV
ncbi:hypothetical protein HD806DRAFT_139279 [Xylariaceae sp. AK1471]|nr:hypothetical protein HD806DRAFT_139279 [Xylariaceae sp. AK1471]